MKKLIFKKIAKDFISLLLFSLILLGIIVWTLQAINYFDLVIEDGHGLKLYFQYTILNFPKIIHRIFLFVFFISLFIILLNYENKNELNILWLNGIGKIEFLNKIIFITILIFFFQILNGSFLAPYSQYKARNLLKNSNIDFFTSLIKEQKFVNVVNGLTIFINKKSSDGVFQDIYLNDSTKKNLKIIYAKNGTLIEKDKKKIFRLYNGEVLNNDKSVVNILEFDRIDFNLSDYDSNTTIAPKIQEIDTYNLIHCLIIKQPFKEKNIFRCEKEIYNEILQELLKRLYSPIYLIIISIISCSLILISKNNLNYNKVRNLIFITGIFIIILSETLLRYSTNSSMSFIIYITTPIILIIFFYALFMRWIRNV